MPLGVQQVFIILGLLFAIMAFSGAALLINIMFFGVADQAADNMGVNNSSVYHESVAMQESAIQTSSNTIGFLPWLGIGLVFFGALGLGTALAGLLKFGRR